MLCRGMSHGSCSARILSPPLGHVLPVWVSLQQGCPWLPWELPFLWWVQEGHQEAASFLHHENTLAPPIFFKGQRQQAVRSGQLYPGCCDCSQPGVRVPRRGVWAVWQTDAVDSSQDDASLEA